MNERIKQLADEAEDYADSIVDQGGEFHLAYTEKFAELIVKQCAMISDFAHLGGVIEPGVMVKEYFGVE